MPMQGGRLLCPKKKPNVHILPEDVTRFTLPSQGMVDASSQGQVMTLMVSLIRIGFLYRLNKEAKEKYFFKEYIQMMRK